MAHVTRIGGGCVSEARIHVDKTGSPGLEEITSSIGRSANVVVHLLLSTVKCVSAPKWTQSAFNLPLSPYA